MTAKEARELSEAETEKKLRDHREKLVQLRLRKRTGQVENTAEFKTLRRDIARMETILAEKRTAAAATQAA